MVLVLQANKPKWIIPWKVATKKYYNSPLPDWYIYKEDILRIN